MVDGVRSDENSDTAPKNVLLAVLLFLYISRYNTDIGILHTFYILCELIR